jgi:hypothetical protein
VENHFRLYVQHRHDDFDDFVCACVYGALEFSADRFSYVKELHESSVRRYFAGRPDALLVLDVVEGDGWKALCDFLEYPIPDEPYPHANRRLSSPAKDSSNTNLIAKLLRRLK